MGILHGGATEGRLHALSACSAFSVRLSLRWLAMLDSQRMLDSQCSARNAQLAMSYPMLSSQCSARTSRFPARLRPGSHFRDSKCSGRSGRARSDLLVLLCFARKCRARNASVIMSRVRGNPSSRASDRLLCEYRGSKISHVRTGSWVARLATSDLSKTAIKTHLICALRHGKGVKSRGLSIDSSDLVVPEPLDGLL